MSQQNLRVQSRIREIERLQRRCDRLQNDLKIVNKTIGEETSALRKALAGGATTGDSLRDLVIRAHGLNPELEKKYHKLQKELVGKKGEFILVSYHADIAFKFSSRSVETRNARCYRLGVLDGEALSLIEGVVGITLPISRFIHGEEDFLFDAREMKRPLPLEKANIFAHTFGDTDPPPLYNLVEHGWERILFIGDEQVKKWLKEHHMEGLWKPAADALSRLILEPTPAE